MHDVQLQVGGLSVDLVLRGSVHPDGTTELAQLCVGTALLDQRDIAQAALDQQRMPVLLHLLVIPMQLKRECFGGGGLVHIRSHDVNWGLPAARGADATPLALILLVPRSHRTNSVHERGR